MRKSLKEFIKQTNKIIKNENLRINNYHKQIGEYETIMDVITQTAGSNMADLYREKISRCYEKIDLALDKIQHNKEIIATLRTVDKVIKRGEKSA